jgi:hypothetical protein
VATDFTRSPPFGTDHFGNSVGMRYAPGTTTVLSYNIRSHELGRLTYSVQEPGGLAYSSGSTRTTAVVG